MTGVGLHVIMVTISTEIKLGVGRQRGTATDKGAPVVFNSSPGNWLSDLKPSGLT